MAGGDGFPLVLRLRYPFHFQWLGRPFWNAVLCEGIFYSLVVASLAWRRPVRLATLASLPPLARAAGPSLKLSRRRAVASFRPSDVLGNSN